MSFEDRRGRNFVHLDMPVNEMLPEEITRLDHTLLPPGYRGGIGAVSLLQDTLTRIIDELGALSACAQGLNKIITTVTKLRNQQTHTLYLMKDAHTNEGRGEVIGFLRVGRKRLYLFDESAQSHALEPLCVLDLYVREDRQRRGYGKKLFDHMLKDQRVEATQLAIDGPSEKMMSFLKRNYQMELHRQANNFAIPAEFFTRERQQGLGSGRTTPRSSSPCGRYSAPKPQSTIALESSASFGRFAAPQPASSMAAVIHGSGGKGKLAPAAVTGRSIGKVAEDTSVDISERDVSRDGSEAELQEVMTAAASSPKGKVAEDTSVDVSERDVSRDGSEAELQEVMTATTRSCNG